MRRENSSRDTGTLSDLFVKYRIFAFTWGERKSHSRKKQNSSQSLACQSSKIYLIVMSKKSKTMCTASMKNTSKPSLTWSLQTLKSREMTSLISNWPLLILNLHKSSVCTMTLSLHLVWITSHPHFAQSTLLLSIQRRRETTVKSTWLFCSIMKRSVLSLLKEPIPTFLRRSLTASLNTSTAVFKDKITTSALSVDPFAAPRI